MQYTLLDYSNNNSSGNMYWGESNFELDLRNEDLDILVLRLYSYDRAKGMASTSSRKTIYIKDLFLK